MRVASKNSVEEDKCIELNKENIPEKREKKTLFSRLRNSMRLLSLKQMSIEFFSEL